MDKGQLESLDKLQRQDHDTLVRVETKLDNLVSDMKDMKDGIRAQLADHEARIKVSEQRHSRIDIDSLVTKVSTLWDERNSNRGYIAAWSSVGGILAALAFELLRFYVFK